jgi:phosphoribosylformylglycinamidine synthase
MIGLIEDDTKVMAPALPEAGLNVALVGRFKPSLGGSEYLKLATGKVEGPPPDTDLNHEKRCLDLILSLIEQQQVAAVQDVSLGGLLVTLAEMTFANEVGVTVDTDALMQNATESGKAGNLRIDELLFGETAGTYLVAYRPDQEESIKARCGEQISFVPLGGTIKQFELRLDGQSAIPLQSLKDLWSNTLAIL